VERGAGPGVEDPPAGSASIVQDGLTVIAMDVEALVGLATGTTKPLGMEQFEEAVIAGGLIH
jgi:hypothetical protein